MKILSDLRYYFKSLSWHLYPNKTMTLYSRSSLMKRLDNYKITRTGSVDLLEELSSRRGN